MHGFVNEFGEDGLEEEKKKKKNSFIPCIHLRMFVLWRNK